MEHEHEHECGCGHHQDNECGCGKKHTDGCCSDGSHFQRQFLTHEEQVEELEGYLKELKLEVQAVEENLKDLRK